MKETPDSPKPPNEEIINTLRELNEEWHLDFDESDIERLQGMAPDGRIGDLFDALVKAGVADPVAALKEKGILE